MNLQRLLLIISISFSLNLANAQAYMDEIAQKSCGCLETIADTVSQDRYNMLLGLCMIEAAAPHKKQLKKDYGIDFEKIDEQAEQLGQLIGIKMMGFCPEALVEIAARTNEIEEVEYYISEVYEGFVTNIDTESFVVFSVKNDMGKITKFYWLYFADSNLELESGYRTLMDKNVRINYTSEEFFDPRISEYRMVNIIESIDIIYE